MKIRRAWSIVLACVWMLSALAVVQAQTVAPSLSLRDSIPKAEEALMNANLSLADYWLYSITYASSSKGVYWYYTIRSNTPSEFNQIYIKVYMDGSTEISGGPEPA